MSAEPLKKLPWTDGEGPARLMDAAEEDALLQRVLDRYERRELPMSPRRSRRALAFAIAATLVISGAFAAVALREKASPATPTAPSLREEPLGPAAPPQVEPSTAETSAPTSEAPAPEVLPKRASPRPNTLKAPSPLANDTPDDLLALASKLRGQRRWGEAAETYERVIRGGPESPRAYVAKAAEASLLLEHLGDARRALALYRAALAQRPTGALSEEIAWGIAECHRALGDRVAEANALRSFLASYPESVVRARAEARLSEVGRGELR